VFDEIRNRGFELQKKEVKKKKERKKSRPHFSEDGVHCQCCHPDRPSYATVLDNSLSLSELRYKEYIDEKYQQRFENLYRNEQDDAIVDLINEIASDICVNRVKDQPSEKKASIWFFFKKLFS
jgi:hypothetical protein